MRLSSSLSLATSARLFATGFTLGPIVDSLHNQCLLQYKILPISLAWPSSALTESSALSYFPFVPPWNGVDDFYPYFFCSSWTVPPLLGVAYVVLGGILPRLLESGLKTVKDSLASSSPWPALGQQQTSVSSQRLGEKAWIAVTTTAMIIKLSEIVQTYPPDATTTNGLLLFLESPSKEAAHLLVMMVAALSQWALLDGTLVALLAASITSIAGPLSEIPFVAYGVWEYLPGASDYFPLEQFHLPWLGTLGEKYSHLSLSSITGPCYFAVTMDAIALGRWFDSMAVGSEEEEEEREEEEQQQHQEKQK